MQDDTAADLDLAQRCLESDETAIVDLRRNVTPWLRACLLSAGASAVEAEDLLCTLWTDCVCGLGGREPRLTRYRGQCPLRGWLKAVAINHLIDLKRRETRWEAISTELRQTAVEPHMSRTEAPLVEILRDAVTRALAQCSSEALVMLQFVHLHGLSQRELARMWGWHESKISRTLAAAAAEVARLTLENVRETDPEITLDWDDFVELCQSTDFSVFV